LLRTNSQVSVRARDCPIGETVQMADLEIGPLDRRRRGVSIGAFLVWMLIAAAAGAVGWGIYGNDVRSQLGFGQDQSPASQSASVATAPANDDLVAAVKDLQASEKLTADQLEAALVLLNAQQASSKTLAYSLAALSAKVDALERPPAPAAKGTVGESTAKAPHRAPSPPVAITPAPEPAPTPGSGSPPPRDQ
jgi:hypothetical protein